MAFIFWVFLLWWFHCWLAKLLVIFLNWIMLTFHYWNCFACDIDDHWVLKTLIHISFILIFLWSAGTVLETAFWLLRRSSPMFIDCAKNTWFCFEPSNWIASLWFIMIFQITLFSASTLLTNHAISINLVFFLIYLFNCNL